MILYSLYIIKFIMGIILLDTHLNFLKNIDAEFTTLFVEDNREIRVQTINTLNKILPIIIPASDGEEGINLYKEHKNSENLRDFDLIISDIEMPNKNGLEMLAEIKEISPSIPIIITSAYTNTEYFLEAINIGIDNYILKPYTLDNMIAILYSTLKKHQNLNISDKIKINDKEENQKIHIGFDYFYDIFNKNLYFENEVIKLSKNEHALLEILIGAKGQGVPYKNIEYQIWRDVPIQNHSLRSLIYRFRSKTNENLIQTVPSFGFKLQCHTVA